HRRYADESHRSPAIALAVLVVEALVPSACIKRCQSGSDSAVDTTAATTPSAQIRSAASDSRASLFPPALSRHLLQPVTNRCCHRRCHWRAAVTENNAHVTSGRIDIELGAHPFGAAGNSISR